MKQHLLKLIVCLLVTASHAVAFAADFVPDDAWKASQRASIAELLDDLNADDFRSREKANIDFRRRIMNDDPQELVAWWNVLIDFLDKNPKRRTPEVQARLHDGLVHLVRRCRTSCFKQITRCDRDGGELDARDPEVLPDGRIVYFTSNTDGGLELWLLNPKTSKREQITRHADAHGNVDARDPDVLADGRIVYASDRTKDGLFELWALDLKSGKHARVTRYDDAHGSVDAQDPEVLTDGRIVYSTDRTRDDARELWIFDLKSGKHTRVTQHEEGMHPLNPAALPDGQIVYESNTELWVVDPKTGKSRQLTRDSGCQSPAAMPDGRIVCYGASPTTGSNVLWIVEPKSGKRHQLSRSDATHQSVTVGAPAVFPDGRIIYRTDRAKDGVLDLWTVDVPALYKFQQQLERLQNRMKPKTDD